jgi:hypothetical protein
VIPALCNIVDHGATVFANIQKEQLLLLQMLEGCRFIHPQIFRDHVRQQRPATVFWSYCHSWFVCWMLVTSLSKER